jgi:signal recognition particle receptor subunit beta
MVELLHRERTIKVKIVYYGPAIGGKTTNLQVLHQHTHASHRGEFVSINSAQDRTILFDLLPIRAPGFRGFDIRLQVLAVPGQAMYAATRRLVVRGADACVFVANSAADRWEDNVQSFREMTQNLITHQLDPSTMPLVLQYNKRDLPEVTPIDFMDRTLNARRVDAFPAVAVRGEGVLETFSAILLRTMQDLANRYQIVETQRGQTLAQWTQGAVAGMFGTNALALEPNSISIEPPAATLPPKPPVETPAPPPAPVASEMPPAEVEPPARRLVRVALPAEAVRMSGAGPDARANETLVESYAQASSQLSNALTEVREDRDVMKRRVEDLQQILSTAQGFLAGQPLEATLRAVLTRLATAASSTHASFLLVSLEKALRPAAYFGRLGEDPLLRTDAGRRYIQARLMNESEPHVHPGSDALDLGDALDSVEPRFAAVASIPVRTPRGLLGLGMLYYTHDDALPTAEALGHLGMLARALSASLELSSTLETVKSAERSMELAVSGTASVRGLGEVVDFLGSLRDEFGAMRRRGDLPPWFLPEFLKLSPGLAGALASARALVAFGRGEVAHEPVAIDELAADLATEPVELQVVGGATGVIGDRVLLRLALKALIDQAGITADGGVAPVRVTFGGGRVRFSLNEAPPAIGVVGAPSEPARTNPVASLGFVKRVAELHDGALTVDDSSGVRRFTLALPPA